MFENTRFNNLILITMINVVKPMVLLKISKILYTFTVNCFEKVSRVFG